MPTISYISVNVHVGIKWIFPCFISYVLFLYVRNLLTAAIFRFTYSICGHSVKNVHSCIRRKVRLIFRIRIYPFHYTNAESHSSSPQSC